GVVVSELDLESDKLNTIKAIFGGQTFAEGQLHTFPVLQYFPIFLLGIYLGQFFYNNLENLKRIKVNLLLLVSTSVVTVCGVVAYPYIKDCLLFPLPDEGRFPPSLTFLSFSLALTLWALLFFQIFYKLIPKFIKTLLDYLGINAIEFLVFHTI